MSYVIIPKAPANILLLFVFVGINFSCLIVDGLVLTKQSDSLVHLATHFYHVKSISPPTWFLAFNLVLLFVGLLVHIRLLFKVVTSKSTVVSGNRRFIDLLIVLTFVFNIFFVATRVRPLEMSIGNSVGSELTADLMQAITLLQSRHIMATGILFVLGLEKILTPFNPLAALNIYSFLLQESSQGKKKTD